MKNIAKEIDNAAGIILKQAQNYTYQKLLVAEENLKKDIKNFYKQINEITNNIKNLSPKIDQYEQHIKVLTSELDEWGRKEKKKG